MEQNMTCSKRIMERVLKFNGDDSNEDFVYISHEYIT